MGIGLCENYNKTLQNLLKKIASEKPMDWHRYLGPLMFAMRDTTQDSTGFTPFELIYAYPTPYKMQAVVDKEIENII